MSKFCSKSRDGTSQYYSTTHSYHCRNFVQSPLAGLRNIIRQHTYIFVEFLFKFPSWECVTLFDIAPTTLSKCCSNSARKNLLPNSTKHILHEAFSPEGKIHHIFPNYNSPPDLMLQKISYFYAKKIA